MSTGLTLMLAAILVVGGVFRIIVQLVERFPSWGWVRANSVLTVLLAIAICQQRCASGLWAIGQHRTCHAVHDRRRRAEGVDPVNWPLTQSP